MQGLHASIPDPNAGMARGGDPNDPMGGALYDRAVQQEQQFKQGQYQHDMAQPNTAENMQLSMAHSREPMSTYAYPEWSKFYQALNENAPGGFKAPRGGGSPLAGLPTAPNAAPNTMFNSNQSSAVTGRTFNQEQQYQQALQGLKGRR